jgi:glycolate oxidase
VNPLSSFFSHSGESKIVRDLSRILGRDKVVSDELVVKVYAKNASYMEGSALAVIFPESTSDVSKLLRYCYENNVKVYPQGSASELPGSTIPVEGPGVIVSFERMNRIRGVNLTDSYVIVEPGLRIVDLNQELMKYGYMFPIDPASVRVATIGGAINSGAGGMMGVRYGTMRDWVLELEIVLPDSEGTVLRVGCKTMKCRQGYDLVRLIVGSEGTLAVVTEATLKITPIPESVVVLATFFPELESLVKTVIDVKKARFDVILMEFVDDVTVKLLLERFKFKVAGEGHYLLLGVVTSPESTERVLNSLEEILKSNGALSIYKARSMDEAESMGLLDIRRSYYPASIKIASETRRDPTGRIFVFVEDISVPPSKLLEAIRGIRVIQRKYELPMTLGGHVGDGNLHPVVWVEEGDKDKLERYHRMVEEIMRLSVELGGTVSSEHGIGLSKKKGLVMELESKRSLKALEYMKAVKRLFDPKNILNPGKIFE